MTTNAFREYQKEARNHKSGFFIGRNIYWEIASRDLYAGILLSKLAHMFSTPRLTYGRNGKKWRAFTREQWQEEVWLTRYKFDSAISLLKRLRLIEVKVMQHAGQTKLHICLDEKELSQTIVCHQQTHLLATSKPICCTPAIPINSSIETAVGSSGSCVSSSTHAETIEKTDKEIKSGKEGSSLPEVKNNSAQTFGGKMTTSHEAVENLKKKSAEKFGDSFYPTNASQLGSFWMYYVPLHHDTGYIKALTKRQYGQLNLIMNDRKDKPDLLMPTVRWAIEQWSTFAELVKEEKAATLGTSPNIGTLLAFIDTAVNGMQKKPKGSQLMTPKKPWKKITVPKSKNHE